MSTTKEDVHDFWQQAVCGERLYLDSADLEGFRRQSETRYELEPYIIPFADFGGASNKQILEIGVGLGADHQKFAENGAVLSGIDLTQRAIDMTVRRFEALGLRSDLRTGDAERLDFNDNTFDMVYSWGVIHHSPDPQKAVNEIFRVLRPGGVAKVMIYHLYSLVGFMLWLRYGLAAGRPLSSLREIYSQHLESPGTKAYTKAEASVLFKKFEQVNITMQLTHGDLLASGAGQRHNGIVLRMARRFWPRWLFKACCPRSGLYMMIEASKPLGTSST